VNKEKPFKISKQAVYKAYKKVKANRGSCGVDRESIKAFEVNLKNNLYKIWNRMSSGSYWPPPVLEVEIPKKGGVRRLGIPTVSDRIAQMVVKQYLEPELEPEFLDDSYGYRPNKSALEAVGKARERCWRYDWAIDLDIKGCFDNIDHELLMKAVRKHTGCRWILLYIERWLKVPVKKVNGELESRNRGTCQGSVISPLMANLFLHYAFDKWMKRNHPQIPFERYADDILAHSRTETEAKEIKEKIERRLKECQLELNLAKTRIVYCKDDRRKGRHENEKFTFLGYEYRPRKVKMKGKRSFAGFNPGVSKEAKAKMTQKMRKWKLHLRSHETLERLAKEINPVVRGWINYYSKYYRTALRPVLIHLNEILVRWVKRKYKRFRGKFKRAINWLGKIAKSSPNLFAHWAHNCRPAAGSQEPHESRGSRGDL